MFSVQKREQATLFCTLEMCCVRTPLPPVPLLSDSVYTEYPGLSALGEEGSRGNVTGHEVETRRVTALGQGLVF